MYLLLLYINAIIKATGKIHTLQGEIHMKYFAFENESIHLFLCNSSAAPSHDHAFLELAYVVSGEAIHEACGCAQHIRRGDYYLVDFHTKHAYKRVSQETFSIINCLFLPEFIDPTLHTCDSLSKLCHHYLIRMQAPLTADSSFPYLLHDTNGRILQRLEHMMREYETREAGYAELLRCDLLSILLLTLRAVAAQAVTGDDQTQDLCHYISAHYAEKLTLADLAARTHYSIPYLCQKFKRETGVGFSAYLERIRAAEACRLLATTAEHIAEIAQRVGYQDTDSFVRMFRRQNGLSPSAYRKKLRFEP